MSYTRFVASFARTQTGNINKIRVSPSRCRSTVASPKSQEEKQPRPLEEEGCTKNAKDVRLNRIHVDFDNTEEAYKSKNNVELLRSLLVFNLCTIDFLSIFMPLFDHMHIGNYLLWGQRGLWPPECVYSDCLS
uniref:Uncharacterized protein n=1 Tax=Fundulus heteroclitus TaxID=8078 RepID=A0A3Q2NTF3_FUNHE